MKPIAARLREEIAEVSKLAAATFVGTNYPNALNLLNTGVWREGRGYNP